MKHRWTDTDRATLRALYPEFSAAECAAAIGCSVSSINNLVESLVAERKEAADRIAALEAEKADMQDDPPNLECMKPLYAHPLALREPTDDECREIADRFLCAVANAARGVRTGRAMFNAVREVMKK